MLAFLNNISMKFKFGIVLFVPVLGLLFFSTYTVISKTAEVNSMERIREIAESSPAIGNFIHNIQLERDISADFIYSNGAEEFSAKLEDRRRKTNEVRLNLDNALIILEKKELDQQFSAKLAATKAVLQELETIRSAISNLKTNSGAVLSYYSQVITALIDIIAVIPRLSDDGRISNDVTALIAMFQAKEQAGIERLIGTRGFNAGFFDTTKYRDFSNLLGSQKSYFWIFEKYATPELQAAFKEMSNSPASTRLSEMRAIALDYPQSFNLRDISGSNYFKTASDRLEFLKKIENSAQTLLINNILKIEEEALTTEITFLISTVFMLIFSISLGAFILIGLNRALSQLVTIVTDQDADVELNLERKDEIGILNNSVMGFRNDAVKNSQVKVALDSCSANVMVTNTDLDIIYMNDAVTNMMKKVEPDIRKDLDNFDASQLLGTSIDKFYKDSTHLHGVLEALTATHENRILLGGRTLSLITNPIISDKAERIGTVVEWTDMTQELAIQQEIDVMVNAISGGDFTKSLSLEGKEDFMLTLTNSLNSLNKNLKDVVGDVATALGSLSGGDLTHQITTDYTGMYETLKEDVNNTSKRLSETVDEIISTTDEIGYASTEISSGSIDLSQRTETQASSLQETAASMEEMSTTVQQNAESSQQANKLAINACETAQKGGEVVQKAVIAVTGIEQASQKVSDIIGVIDEIAFQTNLLALNAAVEAARAGEAGKGFAVVAAEVRTLAQRSGEAAKDIKTLIIEANEQVKEGVTLVRSTGDTLTEIVDSSKHVADLISEIAASSREQSSGVEEINAAITAMDEMTQQNAALVEQSSAAARTLEEQAVGLSDLVSFFKTEAINSEKTTNLKPVKRRKIKPHNRAPKKITALKSRSSAVVAIEDDDDWSEF